MFPDTLVAGAVHLNRYASNSKVEGMAVLGNQPERNQYRISAKELESFLEDSIVIAKKFKITIEAVIAAKRALELERQNNIAIESGNNTDEQAGGLGEILSRIASALEEKTSGQV